MYNVLKNKFFLTSLRGTPVGVIGAYVNESDIRSWSPEEEKRVFIKCEHCKRRINMAPMSSYWNGMVSPLLNLSVMGVVMSEGENDRGMNISEYSSLLDRTITSWIDQQKLNNVSVLYFFLTRCTDTRL